MTTKPIGPQTKKKAWLCGAITLREVVPACMVLQRNWKSERCDVFQSNNIGDAFKSSSIAGTF